MNRRQFLIATAAGLAATSKAGRSDDDAKKLRVAVIGHTGRGEYGHGLDKVWLSVPETEIVGVADADATGLAAAEKRLNTAGFAEYSAMLAKVKPDIVAICPRHIDQHRDMALAAIAAGARGIYMEKPFVRTPAEADELVEACEKKNVKLAVAHRNRYHPALDAVRRLIKDDGLGRLLEIRGRGKEDQRGGVLDLWVLGSHVMNLAHYFAGKPLGCSATLLQDGRPVTKADVRDGPEGVGPVAGNQLHARFDMELGVPFHFDSIQAAGVKEANFGLQLIGTKGIVDVRVDSNPVAHFCAGNPFMPVKTPREWAPFSSAGPGQPEPIKDLAAQISSHRTAASDLVAAIRGDRQPLCNVHEARTTVEMIAAVLESHRLNGQRVTFPLQTRQNPLALL